MRKFLVIAAVAAMSPLAPSGPARAQITELLPRSDSLPPPPVRHPHRLFISPFGEPFRGPGGLSAWFAQADVDHDGAITLAEFQTDSDHAFSLYDANGDGVIDGLEIQAYERQRVPEISEFAFAPGGAPGGPGGRGDRRRHRRDDGDGDDGGHGGGPDGAREGKPPPGGGTPFRGAGASGAARFSLLNEPEPLLAADADLDGKVSRAEWARAAVRRFGLLDRDSSGRLTLASLQAPPAKR